MTASELRIGNLVKLEGISRPIKVSIIDTTETSTNTKYKPIPLTEEWLLRFGFNYDSSLSLYNINGYDVDCGNGYVHFYVCEYGEWYMNIQYVHSLQNLYFALTGEELTLKE